MNRLFFVLSFLMGVIVLGSNYLVQFPVKQYGLDSAINNIPYDRHEEELSVQKFAKLLKPATKKFLEAPVTLQLPCWARVLACESQLQDDLAKAGLDY